MHAINSKFKLRLLHASIAISLTIFALACQSAKDQNIESNAAKPAPSPPAASGPASLSDRETDNGLPVIVAFGDSLTAGYGLSADQSYTALLQRKLDAGGYKYRVVNAGVSGDTSAGGLARIDWSLEGNVKFLILELGGNDGLRGLPVAAMKKNLAEIIKRAQANGAMVILAGMEAPPNLGAEYTRQFRQAFQDLAKQYKPTFIPFVLDGIGGRVELNQADGIHPNAAGEKLMTENVWRALEPMLKK